MIDLRDIENINIRKIDTNTARLEIADFTTDMTLDKKECIDLANKLNFALGEILIIVSMLEEKR